MEKADDRPTYRLTLRADATHYGDAPPALRLRAALKVLWQRFGLRCTAAEEIHDEPAVAPAEPDPH
jgi:hypothetical protein